jgi:hypothetical protein
MINPSTIKINAFTLNRMGKAAKMFSNINPHPPPFLKIA